jgi:hypothetical protein
VDVSSYVFLLARKVLQYAQSGFEILNQVSALFLYKGTMEEEEEALFRICACRRHSYTAPSMPAETRLRYAPMSKKPYYRGERDPVWSKRGLQFLLAYLRSSVDQQMLLRPTMEQKRPTVEAKET